MLYSFTEGNYNQKKSTLDANTLLKNIIFQIYFFIK